MSFLQDGQIAVASVMGTQLELVFCNPETNGAGLEVQFMRPGELGIHKRARMEPGSVLLYMPPEQAAQFMLAVAVKQRPAQATP